ncbi:MAG: alpha/beta hydrolase [bacterium]
MPLTHGKLQIAHTAYFSVHAPEASGPWPVLIILHGFGQVAAEFINVFSSLPRRDILVAAPQAPHQYYKNLVERRVGFSWLTRFERDQSIQDFVGYMEKFYDLLLRAHRLDRERIFVLGFSQGVSMAYRLWAHSQIPLAGLIACGGDLPPDVCERLQTMKPLRILLVHGIHDQVVPLAKAREARAQLSKHGMPVDWFEFEGEHLVPPEANIRIAQFIAKAV